MVRVCRLCVVSCEEDYGTAVVVKDRKIVNGGDRVVVLIDACVVVW